MVMEARSKPTGLAGLRVLTLESRRAREMSKLIESYGGRAIVASSMREVPLESNKAALDFARELMAGGFDMVIFLTGVGARTLSRIVETAYPLDKFLGALNRVTVLARGPKPAAALKELGVRVSFTVPEPGTWQDLLQAVDANAASFSLRDKHVAVQEYGLPNLELISGLAYRGAKVTGVPVYQWALPEDTAPLRKAVEAIANGEIDVALFTASVQVVHLLRMAREVKREEQFRSGFERIAVGSIGPVTSQELREEKLHIDFEPEHPKMGFLVNEAGRRAAEIVAQKRESANG